jgi:hypothetical protein
MAGSSAKKQAYDTKYESTAKQKENRAARGRARYAYEKKHGDLPHSVDVDHKRMLDAGGGNAAANTRAISASQNRAWRRTHPKAYGKK